MPIKDKTWTPDSSSATEPCRLPGWRQPVFQQKATSTAASAAGPSSWEAVNSPDQSDFSAAPCQASDPEPERSMLLARAVPFARQTGSSPASSCRALYLLRIPVDPGTPDRSGIVDDQLFLFQLVPKKGRIHLEQSMRYQKCPPSTVSSERESNRTRSRRGFRPVVSTSRATTWPPSRAVRTVSRRAWSLTSK